MRLSVVMPARNAAATIQESIDSVLAQTMGDFELIVVDDGSQDDTRAIVAAQSDSRVRLVTQAPRGIAVALNSGIAQARAELIARMDADDACSPRRFEHQLPLLAHADIVSCRVEPLGACGEGFGRYIAWTNTLHTPAQIAHARFIESPLVHPTVMMPRELAVYRLGVAEDYDLWLRLHRQGARFTKAPEFLYAWRDSPLRATRTQPEYSAEHMRALKAEHLLAQLQPSRVLFIGAGSEGKPWLALLRAAGVAVPVVIDLHPRKQGQIIHGARVMLPEAIATHDPGLILIGIGVPGARDEIRALLAPRREGRDYFFVC